MEGRGICGGDATFTFSHLKPRAGAVIEKSLGLFLGGEALGKFCAQLSAVGGGEQACDAEIRLAFECLDFVFALHGETHCYRLHAPADSAGFILRQSTGESSKPTMRSSTRRACWARPD